MRTRTSQVVVPIAAAALAVLGLIALGRAAREGLRQHERYTVNFADIDCPNPPGMTRDEFLAEVQYLARLPDRELEAVAVWRMEGYSVEEVADKLGCAPRSVKRKLRLIRSIWKKEVGDE